MLGIREEESEITQAKSIDWTEKFLQWLQTTWSKVEDVSKSFAPFVSEGFVSLVGHPAEIPIKILHDTGATQTLILKSILPFSNESFTGNSVLLQGIELGTVQVPPHKVELLSDIVSGSVVIGLRPSLLVNGIAFILRNDIAGGKVEANLCVSDATNCEVSDTAEVIPGLFPVCVITRAMAQRAATDQTDICDVGQSHVDKAPDLSIPSSSRNPELAPATTQSSSEVVEQKKPKVMQNLVLSPQRLVEE